MFVGAFIIGRGLPGVFCCIYVENSDYCNAISTRRNNSASKLECSSKQATPLL